MSVITDNIELILAQKKIGKYKFYDDVGISAAAFGRWKSGDNQPKMGNLQRVADYLGVPLRDLLKPPAEGQQKYAIPADDGEDEPRLMNLARELDKLSLRFALFGDAADDVSDDDIRAIKDFAAYIRKKNQL